MGVDQGSQAQLVDMDKLSEPNETGLPGGRELSHFLNRKRSLGTALCRSLW